MSGPPASPSIIGSRDAIRKDVRALRPVPNLLDDDAVRAGFHWGEARGMIDGLPGQGGFRPAP